MAAGEWQGAGGYARHWAEEVVRRTQARAQAPSTYTQTHAHLYPAAASGMPRCTSTSNVSCRPSRATGACVWGWEDGR